MNHSHMTLETDFCVLQPLGCKTLVDWESSLYLDEQPCEVLPGIIVSEP